MIAIAKQALDLRDQSFGRLTAVAPIGRHRIGSIIWRCRCSCGNTADVRGDRLRRGTTTSCGCAKGREPEHGHTVGGRPSREYVSWLAMKARCFRPDDRCYADYGGRGITVCDRWANSFEDFLADMGPRPKGMTLERLNGDGNYEPENCTWATLKTQNRNTRRNRLLTFHGRTQCLSAWAEELGLHPGKAAKRLKLGWSVERTFTTP